MKAYRTIAKDYQHELTIKKSRFICYLYHIKDEEDVREKIATTKKEHYKANHHCSAFILGETSHIKRSSDDGEPSGTAGIPILTVLEKEGVTNVLAVVVRYFGGVKLGSGGLIRAYSSATSETIHTAGLIEIKEQDSLVLHLSYSQYQDFQQWLNSHHREIADPIYAENVTATLYCDKKDMNDFYDQIVDFFNGHITLEKGNSRIVRIPLSKKPI